MKQSIQAMKLMSVKLKNLHLVKIVVPYTSDYAFLSYTLFSNLQVVLNKELQ